MRVDGIQSGGPLEMPELHKRVTPDKAAPSFKDTLATFLKDVNDSQKVAGEAQEKFLAGETTNVHQVMAKSEEAKVAFNMLVELRNKSLEGYQDILRTKL